MKKLIMSMAVLSMLATSCVSKKKMTQAQARITELEAARDKAVADCEKLTADLRTQLGGEISINRAELIMPVVGGSTSLFAAPPTLVMAEARGSRLQARRSFPAARRQRAGPTSGCQRAKQLVGSSDWPEPLGSAYAFGFQVSQETLHDQSGSVTVKWQLAVLLREPE